MVHRGMEIIATGSFIVAGECGRNSSPTHVLVKQKVKTGWEADLK